MKFVLICEAEENDPDCEMTIALEHPTISALLTVHRHWSWPQTVAEYNAFVKRYAHL